MAEAETGAGVVRNRRVVVWRHGQTGHNAKGIWQGQLDVPLSELGEQQARDAAAVLAAYEPAVLWSSDLERAAATARALGELCGLEPRYDERFREIHAGEWQGLSAGDVAERYPVEVEALQRGEDPVRGVSGETVAQVVERARAGVDELLTSLDEGQTAVVATHGVTGRALVAELIGLPQHLTWTAMSGLHNCHWAVVVEQRSGWRLERWNVGAPA